MTESADGYTGQLHADHGGTAAVHDGQRVLQHLGQLAGVGHGHAVGAAGRPGHAGQVGLGLEADVEVVGRGRGAVRVDLRAWRTWARPSRGCRR